MKSMIALTMIISSIVATQASATGTLSANANAVDRITQGHGQPGDTASSRSDPSVTFEVMQDGRVKRTNGKFGTVSISNPVAETLRARRR